MDVCICMCVRACGWVHAWHMCKCCYYAIILNQILQLLKSLNWQQWQRLFLDKAEWNGKEVTWAYSLCAHLPSLGEDVIFNCAKFLFLRASVQSPSTQFNDFSSFLQVQLDAEVLEFQCRRAAMLHLPASGAGEVCREMLTNVTSRDCSSFSHRGRWWELGYSPSVVRCPPFGLMPSLRQTLVVDTWHHVL